ncbi:NnrU family protein [Polycladidibacter hongkongensis]|uniref:NnrU family protein n=1 Tax=Polycladidibacter hongkongensis TaxID=1647556 RepID=UPI0008342656|nr:NnrU family protein [Pseudovibrio hongkongensis]
MTYVVIGMLALIAVHCGLAAIKRNNTLAKKQRGMFTGIAHLLSTLAFILVIYGVHIAREEDVMPLYTPIFQLRHLAFLILMLAAICFFATFFKGRIYHLLQRPLLVSLGLWAGAHLLVNGEPYAVAIFGGTLVWLIVSLLTYARSAKQTSVAEKSKAALWRADALAVVCGLAFYGIMFKHLHQLLIGVPVI